MTRDQFIEISKWQDETFGQATALSKMHHLAEEVIELIEAMKTQKKLRDDAEARICQMEVKTPDLVNINNGQQKAEAEIREEFADCFMLLFGAAASHGYTFEEISGLIAEKHRINKARTWGAPDANGVVRHVKNDTITDNRYPERIREMFFKNDTGTGPVEVIKMHPWDPGLRAERLERKTQEVPKEERPGPATTWWLEELF